MINEDKNCFLVKPNTCANDLARIKHITGYKHREFPLIYIGCPLYVGRRLISTFSDSVSKIVRKTERWHGKLLSVGGRAVLIKHVLQSQPVYLLAAMEPPKSIFLQIERYVSRFFWGTSEGKQRYHWSSWSKMCFPIEEGGTGFRRLKDIGEAFAMKRW